jgi:hypothetical protein
MLNKEMIPNNKNAKKMLAFSRDRAPQYVQAANEWAEQAQSGS